MNSISDTIDYKNSCRSAANDEIKFSTFKTDPSYNAILEHVNREQGEMYIKYLEENFTDYTKHLELFKENDKLGGPRVFEYPQTGLISPTTLRYIKVLSDIKNLMGDLSGKKIIEIGCGYGGQCFILNKFFPNLDYTLVDLEDALMLSEKYLSKLNVKAKFLPADKVDGLEEDYDLVISNYAFSEVNKEFQNKYWSKIIKKSINGYFTLNFVSDSFGIDSYNLEEISEIFKEKNPKLMDEIPKTFEKNIILYF